MSNTRKRSKNPNTDRNDEPPHKKQRRQPLISEYSKHGNNESNDDIDIRSSSDVRDNNDSNNNIGSNNNNDSNKRRKNIIANNEFIHIDLIHM